MENLLEVKGIAKRYDGFHLKDISFDLPKGYIMGLVGPNGAGKTTIIKAIVNAILLDEGAITAFGLSTQSDEIKIKESMGYIADACYFLESWTAKDINLMMRRLYPSWDSSAFFAFLNRYGVPEGKPIKTFSSGTKTKLMLASVFSRETKLLILDEPTSGLDPVMRDEFLTLIKEYIRAGERSVLYSTHITTDLEKTADFITFVSGGRMVFSEETDVIKERYVIIRDSLEALDSVQDRCIGVRKNAYGFEALTTRAHLSDLPSTAISQPASIDEIVVFHSLKGAQR